MKKKEELKSLKEKSVKSLYADLQTEKESLSKAKIKLGQEKKIYPHKVQALRKKIARINTIIYQKLAEELNEKSK
jgi:ribosomal protein L29